MTSEIVKIEISFPCALALTREEERQLDDVITAVCKRYEREHPGRVMWLAGIGAKMLCHPIMLSDDEPIPFDDSVLSLECAEREDYDWRCAKCGNKQGKHASSIYGGVECEFEPVSLANPVEGA